MISHDFLISMTRSQNNTYNLGELLRILNDILKFLSTYRAKFEFSIRVKFVADGWLISEYFGNIINVHYFHSIYHFLNNLHSSFQDLKMDAIRIVCDAR